MREMKDALLTAALRTLALETRERLNLTQKEMARILEMSESSYSDIETGRYACGRLTMFLLLCMQDDPESILRDITNKFEILHEKEMQTI